MASQALINIAMNLSLLPVVGIVLPFFSAGGSAMLCCVLAVGLACSVPEKGENDNILPVE